MLFQGSGCFYGDPEVNENEQNTEPNRKCNNKTKNVTTTQTTHLWKTQQ